MNEGREAGGLMFSYYSKTPKSSYHDSCVPQQRTAAAPSKTYSEGDYSDCDNVTKDKVWKQAVHSERRCLKNWEDNWGFLTEFDPKGRPITPKELPEKVSIFSDDVPNTNAGNYGGRLDSELGQTMQALEFRFYSQQRRRKLGDDLICY